MKIAIPVVQGALCLHFGHCQEFALFDVDPEKKKIIDSRTLPPPAHEPGALPKWLGGQGVNVVIAGGMGIRAQQIFEQSGIQVVIGAPAKSAREVVQAYLEGRLAVGDNVCDH
ncbi:MAG: NifB/NifX family molybdenum-iron cluster-binding protein [Deltaproteobacteria bacterium]|nr:NifB/NifX family molybdenum-iron cluster-binding protein [Deltaproteobacteria bacterium]